MTVPRRVWLPGVLALALVLTSGPARVAGFRAADLPASLSDREFWQLTEDLSEPNGTFQSDNLLSNERVFAQVLPLLATATTPGGVYLGVGPEQNFTYIAAMKPRIAFITDIRRGNLHLQLMYKALFELSADRAAFVSRLFTKPRPAGLTTKSSALELMNAYWEIHTSDEAAYATNLKAIRDHLTETRKLPIPDSDLEGIARVYRTFYWYGPAMTYAASTALTLTSAARGTTYWDLMTQTDASGQGLSYLGSEENFAVLKDLHRRNLVLPVVGNFSGPKALRAIGAYLRSHGATVSAFYVSNVETYLRRDGTWPAFCRNVATMPIDDRSVFIRPGPLASSSVVFQRPPTVTGGVYYFNTGSPAARLMPIAAEVTQCGG